MHRYKLCPAEHHSLAPHFPAPCLDHPTPPRAVAPLLTHPDEVREQKCLGLRRPPRSFPPTLPSAPPKSAPPLRAPPHPPRPDFTRTARPLTDQELSLNSTPRHPSYLQMIF